METSRTTKLPARLLAAILFVLACVVMFGAGCTTGAAHESQATGVSSAAQSQSTAQEQADAEEGEDAEGQAGGDSAAEGASQAAPEVQEDGSYTSKDEVAAYIHEFGHLPGNYISKTKAKKAGWVASKGNLDEVCPGKSIGGGTFYNDDGLLPDAPGRTWKECDIDYEGGYRGEKRIVFSNDGLVYYTGDHYQSFEQLY